MVASTLKNRIPTGRDFNTYLSRIQFIGNFYFCFRGDFLTKTSKSSLLKLAINNIFKLHQYKFTNKC